MSAIGQKRTWSQGGPVELAPQPARQTSTARLVVRGRRESRWFECALESALASGRIDTFFCNAASPSSAARWATAHPLPWPSKDTPELHAKSTRPGVFYELLGEVTGCPCALETLSFGAISSLQWIASIPTDRCSRSNTSCARDEMWSVISSDRVWRNITPAELRAVVVRVPTRSRTAPAHRRAVEVLRLNSFHCAGRGGLRSPGSGLRFP